MSFSINTNIASLEAQNYLRQSSDFQSQTINEVTSGLRIVNSGDDAAGLAVANGLASDQAVLNQGIENANNGLATLQTIDGGMSNINTLLDRAQTLATESASGTFSGDRDTLNQEFQSVLTEINRQAQSIGLNQGGEFAKDLSVFIGGGKGATTEAATANGSISMDLSNSAVDTTSLGLTGYAAGYQVAAGTTDTGLYDLSDSSTTSVSNIISANGSPTTTTFTLSGPGFSDGNAQTVTVNLSGVTDTTSLVNAINAAISAQAQSGSAAATAMGNASVTASIHTGTDGHQQLLFTSANGAFSVAAGDATADALLGNFNAGQATAGDDNATTAVGKAIAGNNESIFNGGGAAQVTTTATALTAGQTQALTFTAYDASGNPSSLAVTLGPAATVAQQVTAINTALQQSDVASLQAIVAVANKAGTGVTFESSGTRFDLGIGVGTAGDGISASTGTAQGTIVTANVTGVGANSDISTVSGAEAAINALTNAVQIFGTAQAAVGRGENNLNYAINLASSETTNEAAAESTIKDADLAQEAANLTKAQILVQAGTAALAQANSAPQQLLTLLQH